MGFALAKPLGWMVLGVPLWWLAHLQTPVFTVTGVWVAFTVLAIVGATIYFLQRKSLLRFVGQRLWLLLFLELGFALVFAFGVLIRLANPDLWHPWFGGEKYMELAIWNGILRSPVFPPIDVHFAGEHLNYYYFGHYMLAVLTKMTGIWTELAFNLAVPTILSLTFLLSWTATFYFHLRPIRHSAKGDTKAAEPRLPRARHMAKSLWAPFLLLVAGNPQSGLLAMEKLRFYLAGGDSLVIGPSFMDWNLLNLPSSLLAWYVDSLGSQYWWEVSRIIPQTINEFPAWSLVFGDLHAHVLVMPWTLLIFCFAVVAVFYIHSRLEAVALLVGMGLVGGLIAATNPWDLPLAFLLTVIAILLASIRLIPSKRILFPISLAGVALFAGTGATVFLPFWLNFNSAAVGGLGLVSSGDMPLTWLSFWGLFYFPIFGWLILKVRDSGNLGPSEKSGDLLRPVQLMAFGAVLLGVSVALQHATFGLTVLPLGLAVILLAKGGRCTGDRAIICWCILVLGIWAGSQVLFVKDFLSGGDYFRMNTVFKYFFQGWLLASLVCAILIPYSWREIRSRRSQSTFIAAAFFLSVLLVLSLGFAFLGVPARLGQRFPSGQPGWGTLDGLDFMNTATYVEPGGKTIDLSFDREAIGWLNDNLRANATILESAQVDYYRSGGTRVASLTGLTGLYGMHQREQRPNAITAERELLIRKLWETPDKDQILYMLRRNEIELIYVGQLEKAEHETGADLFLELAAAGLLKVLFENKNTKVLALPEFGLDFSAR